MSLCLPDAAPTAVSSPAPSCPCQGHGRVLGQGWSRTWLSRQGSTGGPPQPPPHQAGWEFPKAQALYVAHQPGCRWVCLPAPLLRSPGVLAAVGREVRGSAGAGPGGGCKRVALPSLCPAVTPAPECRTQDENQCPRPACLTPPRLDRPSQSLEFRVGSRK